MNRQQKTDGTFAAGSLLGSYRMEHLIGRGDNAYVWLATQVSDGVVVALKVMDGEAASRCYAMSCRAEHPNIVRPTAMFEQGNKGILVMPPCMGRSVETLAGYATERQAWQLLCDIAPALAALHTVGLAHGNVCAENILWDGEHFMLTGFTHSRPTTEGGKPADDVWQLGATVFNLCMGCHVFNGMGMRAQRPSSPLPYMRKTMPRLSETVQRCLAYDGRPSAEEVIDMAKKGQATYSDNVRQKRVASTAPRRQKSDFWPDEMRRVVMALFLLLCCLSLPAQSIDDDKELSDLVKIVVHLCDDYSDKTYAEVRSLLLKDEQWTQMCELSDPPKDGECAPSDPVDCSYLNSILTEVDDLRKKLTTHGDALNGEDPRYYYSLYECYLKAGATVSYDLKGREGAQTFVIVPFVGKEGVIEASITINGNTTDFTWQNGARVLRVDPEDRPQSTERFTLTVSNTTTQSQAFVVINHNTRRP